MRPCVLGRFVIVLALVAVAPVAAQDIDTKAAQAAVQTWLATVDASDYARSWQTAASMFKQVVDEPTWEKAVQGARGRMGALKQRTEKSATATRSAPGAPDGEYVICVFDTTFENKTAAVETVTAMRDSDGAWRVAGYLVR